jgi:EmrB/QacA subfamily drug resistance transporter
MRVIFPLRRERSNSLPAKGTMDTQTIYRRRWGILSVLILSLLAIVLDNTILNVALKTIAEPRPAGLGASQSQLEWAINSYTLVFAGLLFTFGVIGDRIGRKRMLMIGLLLFGVGSLLSAFSRSPDQLIFARAAMGLGGAAVMPQTLSIISNVFEPQERPKAIGIWASAVGIGVAIGPVLGGVLLAHFWWGSVFLVNVPVTIIGAILVATLVPESRNPERAGIDYLGVLLSIAGLVLVVYGIVQGGDTGSWGTISVLGPLFGGLAVLGLFAWWEAHSRHPALDVRLFRDRRLSASVGALALVFFGMGGVYFFTSFYTQDVLGYSPVDAGLLTVPFAVGQLLASPRSAPLVRRFGAKAVGTSGMLIMSIALAGYVLLGTASPVWLLGLLFFIQGSGIGVAMPAATSAVMDVLPRERAGAGSALTNTARQVGVALGTAVLGSILAQAYHSALNPTLNHLPATARGAAGGSIEATQAVAARLGSAGHFLLGPANDAFVSAMHVTTLVAAAISLAGALVVLRWMPGRPRTAAVMDTLLPEAPAEVITEGAPVGAAPAPVGAAPAATAFEAAPPAGLETALDAATGPGGIDPIEALDVWQENLSARSSGGER